MTKPQLEEEVNRLKTKCNSQSAKIKELESLADNSIHLEKKIERLDSRIHDINTMCDTFLSVNIEYTEVATQWGMEKNIVENETTRILKKIMDFTKVKLS